MLVGPEAERAQEVIKSALRVVFVINNIPDVKPNRNWSEFMSRIAALSSASEMMGTMSADRSELL